MYGTLNILYKHFNKGHNVNLCVTSIYEVLTSKSLNPLNDTENRDKESTDGEAMVGIVAHYPKIFKRTLPGTVHHEAEQGTTRIVAYSWHVPAQDTQELGNISPTGARGRTPRTLESKNVFHSRSQVRPPGLCPIAGAQCSRKECHIKDAYWKCRETSVKICNITC